MAPFEEKIRLFMRSQGMYMKGDKVAVMVSGGKDSSALAYIFSYALRKDDISVEIVHLDLGIPGYSEGSLEAVEEVSERTGIPLRVLDIKEKIGRSIPEMAEGRKACTVCGIVKRHFASLMAKEYDVVATGHNLDDILSFFMNNILTGRKEFSSSLLPVSEIPGLGRKVKPFYFVEEMKIMDFVREKEIPFFEGKCPFSYEAPTVKIRRVMDTLEKEIPGSKKKLLKYFMGQVSAKPIEKKCAICGLPSLGNVCAFCRLVQK